MEVHFSSKKSDWATPQTFFDALNKQFKFTLDPCADKKNAKCRKFFTAIENGLLKSWKGERVFCNPPYGREIGKWVEKCATGGGRCYCGALTRKNGYKMVSRSYLSEGHHSVFEGPTKIWRFKKLCALPFYAYNLVLR